jgi:periplasmic divalent cation tolerance protein
MEAGPGDRTGVSFDQLPDSRVRNFQEDSMQVNFVYMTAGNTEEAKKIGKELVSAGLAACVNILDNMNSIYIWDGQLQEDSEVVMIAKTTENRVPQLVEKVKSLHSYDCPCIVSLPVLSGNPAFLDWIVEKVES